MELKSVKKFQNDLLAWFDLQHADICEAIQTGGQLTDELKKQIDEAAEPSNSSKTGRRRI